MVGVFGKQARVFGGIAMKVPKERKIGILLPTRGIFLRERLGFDAEPVLQLAEIAEQLGLDSVWVGDSLTAKPRLEPLATLAAVAARTKTVDLGTAVLLAPLRQPILLAQMVATVNMFAKGRLVLGVGVGGVFDAAQKSEWIASGVDPSTRGIALSEMMQILPQLWLGETVTFKGEVYEFDQVRLSLNSNVDPNVPIYLACHSRTGTEKQLRRAGRYANGVISISDSPEEYKCTVDKVKTHASGYGRDPDSIRTAFYMTVNLNDDIKAARDEADRFIRNYYGRNVWQDSWGPFGPPDLIAQQMESYFNAGAEELIIRFASSNPIDQMDLFCGTILQDLRKI